MGLQPGFTQSVLANKYRGETPTPGPAPGRGTIFGAVWRATARQTALLNPPLPPGKGVGGMGLQPKPTK